MKTNLPAIKQENALAILSKTKNLLSITNRLLSKNEMQEIVQGFTHKYLYLTCCVGSVYAVAITPDGKQIVYGGNDEIIKIRDIYSGVCIKTLEGHSSYVNSIAITPDGKKIVSGSYDNTIKIWDIESGACLKTIKGHSNGIESISIASDGTHIVSGGDAFNCTIKVWDKESGAYLKTLEGGPTGWIATIAITPDGKQIVSICDYNTIKIWDIFSGEIVYELVKPSNYFSVALYKDGQLIAFIQ